MGAVVVGFDIPRPPDQTARDEIDLGRSETAEDWKRDGMSSSWIIVLISAKSVGLTWLAL